MNFFKKLFSKPLSITLKITSSNGFHLRPVAKFVSVAKSYPCDITADFKDQTVSAKAINALLSLGLEKGDTFTLILQGKQAQEALDKLSSTFTQLMHEDKEITEVMQTSHNYTTEIFRGDTIYAGIDIAHLYLYEEVEKYSKNTTTFQEAVSLSLTQLDKLYRENTHNADIFLAQQELLNQLATQSDNLESFTTLIYQEIAKLKNTKLESKNIDYLDLLKRVKSHLGYHYETKFPTEDFILVADDLLPSVIEQLDQSAVVGVILKKSALTSHTAILLRSAGIPSMLLSTDFELPTHEVILDTYAGVLLTTPNDIDMQKALALQKSKQQEADIYSEKRFKPAITKEGKKIKVYANVTDPHSATEAKEEGAEGIGLLRTEFLFTKTKPALEAQEKAYAEIFELFNDVTVRTLDVGGDKALPYLSLPKEDNPFLGIRGIRLLQTHPELITEQLLAIFKAAKNKHIKIMFPMISSVKEFSEAKNFAIDIAKKHHIDIDNILFGMMIEVPSVLFALPEFDKVVDFYSVGTNDLTQYLFATERTHPTLKTDALSPIVFKALEQIVTQVTKPLSICGELASEPQAIEKLTNLGFTNLSITPKQIPKIKEMIRHV